MNNFNALSENEMLELNGGEKTVSDWCLLGAGVALCFVNPYIGVPATVVIWALT